MTDDEPQLVQRCRTGQAEAFEALHAAHAGRVKAYFARSGFGDADRDDLTQETFVRAFRSLDTFDPSRGAFGAWVAAIARNVARRAITRRGDARDFDPQLAEETLADGDDPARTAGEAEELDALRKCIAALPTDLANLVHLRYIEARTTRGMAAVCGLPEATVRLRLDEAKAALERCLRCKGLSG